MTLLRSPSSGWSNLLVWHLSNARNIFKIELWKHGNLQINTLAIRRPSAFHQRYANHLLHRTTVSVRYTEISEANDLDKQCVVWLVVYKSSSRGARNDTSSTGSGQWRLPWCNLLLRIVTSACQWLGDIVCLSAATRAGGENVKRRSQKLRCFVDGKGEGESTGKSKFFHLQYTPWRRGLG